MAGIFIHVGYPKCGSSFIQDVILSRTDQVFDYERAFRLGTSLIWKPGTRMTQAEQDADIAALLDDFHRQDKPLVVSNEAYATGRWADADDPSQSESFERVVEKVKHYFPVAHIIFVLRPQHEWIRSWWSQHAKGFGPIGRMSLADAYHSDFFKRIVQPRLRYNKVIGTYRELYGEGNVHVQFMRTLARDTDRFVQEFCATIGIDFVKNDGVPRNKSASYGMNVLRTRMNAAYHSLSRRLLGPASLAAWDERYRRFMKFYLMRGDFLVRRVYKPRPFNESQLQEIEDMFRDDNRELADMLGIDLAPFGFATEAARR